MKKTVVLTILTIFLCQMSSCSGEKGDVTLDTVDKKFSYTMGYEAVGAITNLETVTIDEESFVKGIRDAFGNELPLLTQQQGLDVKSLVFDNERAHKNQRIMKDTEKNLSEQKTFLEQNKTGEGITATGSGLQYKILEKGDGAPPAPEDFARIYSRARLLDGTLIKALSTTEEPTFVPVKGNLPFWEEALTLMPTGSRYRFFVPSALAYGDTGNFIDGGPVGPYQLIIIDIELLEVKKSTDFLTGS
jgi:FKBP-type peptidyl-prolyl cis-trans isomerase